MTLMACKITPAQYNISMHQIKEDGYNYDFDGRRIDYEVGHRYLNYHYCVTTSGVCFA
jgi:hypothetical protein